MPRKLPAVLECFGFSHLFRWTVGALKTGDNRGFPPGAGGFRINQEISVFDLGEAFLETPFEFGKTAPVDGTESSFATFTRL